MLRLPGPEDTPGPLVAARSEAAEPDHEELHDEGDPSDSGEGGTSSRWMATVVVLGLLAATGCAWWLIRETHSGQTAQSAPPPPPRAETFPAAAGTAAPANLSLEIEAVAKAFLEAPSVAEASRWVRLPEETVPKIEAWLAGEPYKAPGFREISGDYEATSIGGREVFISVVRTGDFAEHKLNLVKEEAGLRVDWESWAGWSELPWDQFMREKPTEPKRFRVLLSESNYYNFSFKDDLQWVCYRLESPDGDKSLFGYAERGAELAARIHPMDGSERRDLLLKLKFPPDAKSDNQVIIDGVTGEGWIDLESPPSP